MQAQAKSTLILEVTKGELIKSFSLKTKVKKNKPQWPSEWKADEVHQGVLEAMEMSLFVYYLNYD